MPDQNKGKFKRRRDAECNRRATLFFPQIQCGTQVEKWISHEDLLLIYLLA